MIKKISIIIVSFVIATSIVNLKTEVKAESLDNATLVSGRGEIQTREAGAFLITHAFGGSIFTSPSEMSYEIIKFPYGTMLWRIDYGPTYDSAGRPWYHVRTYEGTVSGWILGSKGRPQ